MNPIESEVQVIIVDALQHEQVSAVDVSGLKIVPDGSAYAFAGRLVVVLADGSAKHYNGVHGRSDFVARYGFGLFTFAEMSEYETRTYADDYDGLRTELDGDTVRLLNVLRGR
jgi:hypothetical protein